MQEVELDIEYFLAVLPPKTEQELPHDDWCGRSSAHETHVDPLDPAALSSLKA